MQEQEIIKKVAGGLAVGDLFTPIASFEDEGSQVVMAKGQGEEIIFFVLHAKPEGWQGCGSMYAATPQLLYEATAIHGERWTAEKGFPIGDE